MGMFDEVRCHATLPDDAELGATYQTKSLDCRLDLYIITSDGRLTKRQYDNDEPAEPCDFTGDMHFGDYAANFACGRLMTLRKVTR